MALHPGVFLVNGAPTTWRTKVMAATLWTGGIASHRTAAARLEVNSFTPGAVELIVPRSAPAFAIEAIVHRSTDFSWFAPRLVDGIPTTPVDRLAVDLGAVVSFRRYARAVDDLLLRKEFAWESMPDSALELAFQRLLQQAGLPPPTPQVAVYDRKGFIGRVGFAFPDRRIAIELNGKMWHLNGESFEKDHRRVLRLQRAGWFVLSFTWAMVMDTPDSVIAAVRAALRQDPPETGA